jgi:hypothetical protein
MDLRVQWRGKGREEKNFWHAELLCGKAVRAITANYTALAIVGA